MRFVCLTACRLALRVRAASADGCFLCFRFTERVLVGGGVVFVGGGVVVTGGVTTGGVLVGGGVVMGVVTTGGVLVGGGVVVVLELLEKSSW
jgi:hypothetical protein